jgi:circadian clock protein KaiC
MATVIAPERRHLGRTEAGDFLERLSSGNREADYILGGGFPANSINIVMGHPGSGKTIFAEQLIFENATDDRPILYFTTLSEPLPKVVRYLRASISSTKTSSGPKSYLRTWVRSSRRTGRTR